MGNNLIKGSFQLDSTKLIRGTAFSYAPFELKLQLHGQVSNPYTFTIKEDYKSSAITKINTHPYTEKSWTTPGTYTWTVPTAVTRIRVAVCGGGGGATYSSSHQADGSVGGTSSIKLGSDILIQATGGGGAHLDGDADGIISSKCRVGAAGTNHGLWNADPDIPPTSGFVLIAYGQGIE